MIRVSSYGKTKKGAGRVTNGDAMILDPRLNLFAVADSVGVGAWRKSPAERVLTHMAKYVAAKMRGKAAHKGATLSHAIYSANEHLLDLSEKSPGKIGSTTITSCLIAGDHCCIAHAGDSVALHVHEGRVRRITSEDTVAGVLRSRNMISESKSMTHPNRNWLLRSLGNNKSLEINTYDVSIEPGDLIILMTDEIARTLGGKGIASLALARTASEAWKKLPSDMMAAALRGGCQDDMTVIVLKVYATPCSQR